MLDVGSRDLFGPDEPLPEHRTLRAGKLSAMLVEGNLRDIRYGGAEGVRAINDVARHTSWGTFGPR